MKIELTSSDVWILVSVAAAAPDGPADLSHVIAAGDMINHALLSPAELRRGFSKLTKSGYVAASSGAYSLTASGRALVDEASRKRRSWLDIWEEIARSLAAGHGPDDDPRFEDPRHPYPQISDEDVADAIKQYLARLGR